MAIWQSMGELDSRARMGVHTHARTDVSSVARLSSHCREVWDLECMKHIT
jgi:hypothetical protein